MHATRELIENIDRVRTNDAVPNYVIQSLSNDILLNGLNAGEGYVSSGIADALSTLYRSSTGRTTNDSPNMAEVARNRSSGVFVNGRAETTSRNPSGAWDVNGDLSSFSTYSSVPIVNVDPFRAAEDELERAYKLTNIPQKEAVMAHLYSSLSAEECGAIAKSLRETWASRQQTIESYTSYYRSTTVHRDFPILVRRLIGFGFRRIYLHLGEIGIVELHTDRDYARATYNVVVGHVHISTALYHTVASREALGNAMDDYSPTYEGIEYQVPDKEATELYLQQRSGTPLHTGLPGLWNDDRIPISLREATLSMAHDTHVPFYFRLKGSVLLYIAVPYFYEEIRHHAFQIRKVANSHGQRKILWREDASSVSVDADPHISEEEILANLKRLVRPLRVVVMRKGKKT
jgi:hypothetical protein